MSGSGVYVHARSHLAHVGRGGPAWSSGSRASRVHSRLARQIVYPESEYREWTEATYAEITQNRFSILGRLLGRLNRALNDDSIPLPDFDASAT